MNSCGTTPCPSPSPSQRQRLKTELFRLLSSFCSPSLNFRDLLEEGMLLLSEELVQRRSFSQSTSPTDPSAVRLVSPPPLVFAARKDQAHLFFPQSLSDAINEDDDEEGPALDTSDNISLIAQEEEHELDSVSSEPLHEDLQDHSYPDVNGSLHDIEFTNTLGSAVSMTDMDNAFILDGKLSDTDKVSSFYEQVLGGKSVSGNSSSVPQPEEQYQRVLDHEDEEPILHLDDRYVLHNDDAHEQYDFNHEEHPVLQIDTRLDQEDQTLACNIEDSNKEDPLVPVEFKQTVVASHNPSAVNSALLRDERDEIDFLQEDNVIQPEEVSAPKKKRVRLSVEDAILKKQEELLQKQKAQQEKLRLKLEAEKEKARLAMEAKAAAALLKEQKKAEKAQAKAALKQLVSEQKEKKRSKKSKDQDQTSLASPDSAFAPPSGSKNSGKKRKRIIDPDFVSPDLASDVASGRSVAAARGSSVDDDDDDMFGLNNACSEGLSEADELVSVSSNAKMNVSDDDDENNISVGEICDDVDIVRKRTVNGKIYLVSMKSIVYDLNENEVGKLDPTTGQIVFKTAAVAGNSNSSCMRNDSSSESESECEDELY